jgi:hypothetical protein
MVEHDELMRQAVAGLRASRTPTPGAQDRVFAALELQLGGPPGGFDPSGGAGGGGAGAGGGSAAAGTSSTVVSVGWVAKVVGATVGLTGGGLLLVWTGASALQPSSGDRESVRDEVTVTDTVDVGDVRLLEDEAGLPAADEPAISVVPGARAKPRTADALEPIVLQQPTDTLSAELELLSAAKRASTPSAALALLEQHASEYPNGTMASEREALAVVALCQLDRTEEARARTRVLIAQRPSLPLLHHMRDECPALTNLLRQMEP